MFDAFFRQNPETKNDLYRDLSQTLMGGYQTRSGRPVNWRTALECVTVLACVRVIAEGLAQVPCKLYRDNNGTKAPATDHPLFDLLHRKPNAWQTSFEFREQMALHLALNRNAYAFIVRNRRNQVIELLPLEPGWVQVVDPERWGDALEYRITIPKGQHQTVAASSIWHLRGLSWDGIEGLDGVKLAREAIGLSTAAEEQSARLFANGTKPSGILTTDQMLRADQVKEFRDQWQENYAGTTNAGKTPILWGGFRWAQAALDMDKAQMIETRRLQIEQICAAFRVLPIMIGYSDKTATYASAEQMFLSHVIHTLGPWIERIEQSADVNLLTDDERRQGYYTHFVTAGLLRGAHKDRAEYYAKALGHGGGPAWMTPDEVRALEELNPQGGAAGRLPITTNTNAAGLP